MASRPRGTSPLEPVVSALRPTRGRRRFLEGLVDDAEVLDVGCGNGSPRTFKSLRPDIRYVVSIDFAARRYRPAVYALVGLLNEPVSRRRTRTLRGTWALWGFETVTVTGFAQDPIGRAE